MEHNTNAKLEEQIQASHTQLQAALARLQQQVRQVETINRIAQVMNQVVALDEVLQTIVDLLPETLQVSRCLILQSNSHSAPVVRHVSHAGIEPGSLMDRYCVLYQRHVAELAQGQPVVISRLEDTNITSEIPIEAGQCQVHSVVLVPIVSKQSYWGGILLHQWEQERTWTDEAIAFLQSVANHCGIAIYQAELALAAPTEQIEQQQQLHQQTTTILESITDARDVTDFKQTHKALQESQQLLQAILDTAPISIYVKDLSGRYMLLNHYCEVVSGLSQEQVLGKTDYDIWAQELGETFRISDQATLYAGTPVELEEVFPGPDGLHTFISLKFPLYDAAGTPYATCGISTEITDRKQMETALRESEERFCQLVEHVDAVFWVFSFDEQKTLYVSPAYEKIWGRSPQPLYDKSQNWMDAIHPEDHAQVFTLYQRLIHGEPVEYVYRIVKPDNSVRLICDRAFPVYDSQGRLYRATGIAEDITEREQTEAALRASEQKYRNLVETSQGVIWSVNTEGRITFVNQAVRQIYGYEPQEMIGRFFSEFVTPEQAQKDREMLERILAGESVFQYEAECVRKDGTLFWVSCNIIRLHDDAGNIIGTMGTSVDISQRKRAEEKIKASLQEKEVLLKEVHHRVRNNLQIISSLLDLQSQYIQEPLVLEVFRASQNRVKSIALIHQTLYKSENLARVKFADYIYTLTGYLLQTYPINSNNITWQIKVDEIYLNLDTVIPCGLIINELVSNALKYAFPDNEIGTIWIEFNSVEVIDSNEKYNQFNLVVGNDGVKLKEPPSFPNSTSLGFKLVDALVYQINGEIELDQSRGTEFRIRFPDPNSLQEEGVIGNG